MDRKFFSHNLVEYHTLQEETLENGTRFYITPRGDKYKSVTTIISENTDQRWLVEWKKRIGERKAKQISLAATRRGSAVHLMAEKYVMNEDNYEDESPFYLEMFQPIKKVLDNCVDNIYGVEVPLFSHALKTAGRTDLVAQYGGINSVIDYKTSKRIKKEEDITGYFLQSTVYSLMFERLYGVDVPQIVVILTVEDEAEPLVFVKNRGKYINQVLDMFL